MCERELFCSYTKVDRGYELIPFFELDESIRLMVRLIKRCIGSGFCWSGGQGVSYGIGLQASSWCFEGRGVFGWVGLVFAL